jgi:energy-coupling factor transporter ATP-binding protein EcfA2
MEAQSIKLCGPFTCIVAGMCIIFTIFPNKYICFWGSSGQGKSTLVSKIITQAEYTIEDPIESIVWLYKEEADQTHLFDFLKRNCGKSIKFIKGFEEKLIDNDTLFPIDGKQRVLVVDDLSKLVPFALANDVYIIFYSGNGVKKWKIQWTFYFLEPPSQYQRVLFGTKFVPTTRKKS